LVKRQEGRKREREGMRKGGREALKDLINLALFLHLSWKALLIYKYYARIPLSSS